MINNIEISPENPNNIKPTITADVEAVTSRKIKEIASINNISESKVKVMLHRTRNKLRKELLKGGYSLNG